MVYQDKNVQIGSSNILYIYIIDYFSCQLATINSQNMRPRIVPWGTPQDILWTEGEHLRTATENPRKTTATDPFFQFVNKYVNNVP